jgi:hypothetical protein
MLEKIQSMRHSDTYDVKRRDYYRYSYIYYGREIPVMEDWHQKDKEQQELCMLQCSEVM